MPNYTLLIIDYEPRSVQRLRQALEGAGYGVEVAPDGVTGLRRFKEIRPAMVLVEAMIPKKSGFDVCLEMKRSEQGGQTPVVIITSVYKGRKYRSQALHHYKADEFIEKPVADSVLLEHVRRFLPADDAEPAQKPQAAASYTPPILRQDVDSRPVEAHSVHSDAETEIDERLDSILGETEASILRFDPYRSFGRGTASTSRPGSVRLGGGGAEPLHKPDPAHEPHRRRPPHEPAVRTAPAPLGVRLWLWVALAVVAAVSVLIRLFV